MAKSVSEERISSNFDLFDWRLSNEDMNAFDGINCGWRHLLWREVIAFNLCHFQNEKKVHRKKCIPKQIKNYKGIRPSRLSL